MNTGLALAAFIDGPLAIVGGFGAVAAGAFGTYSILESQIKTPKAITSKGKYNPFTFFSCMMKYFVHINPFLNIMEVKVGPCFQK